MKMEPLELGEFIRISNFDTPLDSSPFYKVIAKEPFVNRSTVGTSNDFPSTVSNNANSDWKQIKKLEPSKKTPKTIYHVSWGVQNGLLYRAKLPAAVERFGLDDAPSTGYISNLESDWLDPDEQFEFFTQEGNGPNFIAYHNDGTNGLSGQLCSGLGAVYPRILFKGWRNQLEEANTVDKANRIKDGKYRTIVMGGLRS